MMPTFNIALDFVPLVPADGSLTRVLCVPLIEGEPHLAAREFWASPDWTVADPASLPAPQREAYESRVLDFESRIAEHLPVIHEASNEDEGA
jgi:hypothetical protein